MAQVGKKADSGKAPVAQGGFLYFPRAIAAVSRCSEYGRKKYNTVYSERNFMYVEDGVGRYTDGMLRHLGGEMLDAGGIDPETNLPHAYAVAWNALARLEIMLEAEAASASAEPNVGGDKPTPHHHPV